jgi:MFS transporter, DHA2 family, multidrug resistance protein
MSKSMSRAVSKRGASPGTGLGTGPGTGPGDPPSVMSPGRRVRGRWWALAAIVISVVAVGLDSYIVVTALPTFSVKLGASTSQLQWLTAAYTLAWAGLLLPIGKLGDKFGRRRLLLGGLALFGAASVAASQSNTVGELISLRAVMGAGAAVIMPMSLAIVPVLFPAEADRRRAVTAMTIGAMISLPLGPLLGGWLLSHFAWGWIFLINGPVVVLALLGVWLLVPESRDPANPRIDWPGALLSAAGITGVVYAIIEEPLDGWNAQVLASLLGGFALIGLFVVRQRFCAAPLIDLRLLRNRLFSWGTIAFAALSFAMTGVLFVLTPYLQIVQGNDAQGTGLRLLPMIGALMVAAAGGLKFAARIGVRFVIPGGMLVGAGGLVVLAHVHAGSGYGIVALALVIFGGGLGLGLPLAADAVLSTLAPHQSGMGNALSRTLQSVGVALGTAILGSVLSSAYRTGLTGHLAGVPSVARNAAAASVAGAHGVAAHLPGSAGSMLTQLASTAYAHGMARAMAVCVGLLTVGAIICLIMLPGKAAKATAPEPGPEIR